MNGQYIAIGRVQYTVGGRPQQSFKALAIVNTHDREACAVFVNGFADLNVFDRDDEILIQHVSYIPIKELKSKIKDTVFLVQNKYVLNTINFEEVKTTIITGLNPLSAIKRKEIERLKNRSMGELLKQSIGIHVQESQSGGGSPNFRGMEANRLLVIVDGIALNNAIYRSGHVQSSNIINSFFVDKINVVTGPASVVYGCLLYTSDAADE